MSDPILVRHDDLVLRWDRDGRLLARRGLSPRQLALPPRAVALVHAFDGQRDTAAAIAWAGVGAGAGALVATLCAMGLLVTVAEANAAAPVGPRVSRQVEICGREALVLDGLAPPGAQQALFEALTVAEFARLQHSTAVTAHRSRFSLEVALDDFSGSWLAAALAPLIASRFPREDFYPSRVYADCLLPSDAPIIHTDCWPVDRDLTLVYYACAEWRADWGGETIVYDDDDDGRLPVTPRPGRGVLFRGALRHGARPPSPLAPVPRYSVAIKLRSVPRGAAAPTVEQWRTRPHIEPKAIF